MAHKSAWDRDAALASRGPGDPGPDHTGARCGGRRRRRREPDVVRGLDASLSLQEPRDPRRGNETRARAHAHGQDIAARERSDEHVIDAGAAIETLDPRPARRLGRAHQRGQQRRRQIHAREPDLGRRLPGATPHGQAGRVRIGRERRGEPPRVQLARGARGRRGRCRPQTLQQRRGARVGRGAQPERVPLREHEPAFHSRAPRDECGRRPRHRRDPEHGPGPRRRHQHAHQRGQPHERVPLGPGPVGIPQP